MAYKIKPSKVDTGFGKPVWTIKDAKKVKDSSPQFDSEYDKQAYNFLKDTNTKFSIKYLKHDKYFPDDEESRDSYRFTLIKDGKRYSGTFGQSIAGKGKKPSAYDVLASLGGDRFEGDFEEFCDTFGYNTDSRKAGKIYNAVVKENEGMKKLYSSEELDKLGEIQ